MDEYKVIKQAPSAHDFIELRKAVKWEVSNENDCKKGLENSTFIVNISCGNNCIACGRILGDNSLVFIIQDIMVHPDHQGKGLGKKIMSALMTYVEQYAADRAFIGLFSASDLEGWYEHFGFVKRPNDFLGCGMSFIHKK